MAKRGLTVAKADEEEFQRVWDFVHAMEALFDGRGFFSNEEDWREWDDDDEDKQMLLKFEKEIIESDGSCWDGKADNRLILYEFMKHKFNEANYSGSFGRILMDCQVLIENCDPDLDYVEFKPSIMYAERDALAKVEEIIDGGKEKGLSSDAIIEVIKARIDESKKDDEKE